MVVILGNVIGFREIARVVVNGSDTHGAHAELAR